jgi:RNA polymerase sigma-70 factor, ECF subfamily
MAEIETPDWEKLVERHARRVFGVAMRILGSTHEAEDVAQEVFSEAFQLHRAGPVQSWTGLLVRLATIRSIDRYRRKRSFQPLRETDRTTTIEPCEDAMARELAALLREAIRQLPDQQAAIFTMTHFEQMNREAVATALEISPGAVSTALYKARQRLAAVLVTTEKGASS